MPLLHIMHTFTLLPSLCCALGLVLTLLVTLLVTLGLTLQLTCFKGGKWRSPKNRRYPKKPQHRPRPWGATSAGSVAQWQAPRRGEPSKEIADMDPISSTPRTEAQAKLRLAKTKFTRAAMATIVGAPGACELATAALYDLDAAFAEVPNTDAHTAAPREPEERRPC